MSDIQELEVQIEDAKAAIKLGDSVERLFKNRDFKAVICNEYFKEYAAGLVMQKSVPAMQTPEHQLAIENALIGIGELNQFLTTLRMRGKHMEHQMAAQEATLDELQAEELEELDEE